MEVVISKSPKKDKRLQAKFETRTIHFGQAGGQTFVDHKDDVLKKAWIARHKVNGTFDNMETASGLAKGILWNKSNMKTSINHLNKLQKRYKFKVK